MKNVKEFLYTNSISVLLVILGIILLAIGIKPHEIIKDYVSILQGVGGALIGVGASNIINSMFGIDFYEKTYTLIKKEISKEIKSDSELLEIYKDREYYEYHITKTDNDSQGCWYFYKFKFSQSTRHTLSSEFSIKNKKGKTVSYKCEVGVRNGILLIIIKPKHGLESASVILFTNACKEYEMEENYGIVFGEMFTGIDGVRPSIISSSPLIRLEKLGFVPEKHWQELNEIWDKNFKPKLITTTNLKI
jgi:hypothetical protein